MTKRMRIASASFAIDGIDSFATFKRRVAKHVNFAVDTGCACVVFPEYITAPLLAIKPDWNLWTELYTDFFRQLAVEKGIHILGGTHLTMVNGVTENLAFFFTKNGEVLKQPKAHATPFE